MGRSRNQGAACTITVIAVLQHGRRMAAPTRTSVGQGDSPPGAGIRSTPVTNTSTRPSPLSAPALGVAPPWRATSRGLVCMPMAEIVLRVRLIGGERLDVTYEEDGGKPGEIADQAISTLAEQNGVLRCRHGDRLIMLYGRGIATLEIAP